MAFTYANGRYPLSKFIHRGDNIYLTPSLNARWNEAVRLAKAKYGVRLWITGDVDGLGGWNGYRPYDAQVRYKRHYGRFAAAPGWSSHGGQYGGREVFALDVANWQQLGRTDSQAWGRFVAIMRLVGLTTNFVTPTELWHVGDFNDPWVAPTFGNTAGNIKPIPGGREEDEDDMPTHKSAHFRRTGGQRFKKGQSGYLHRNDKKATSVLDGPAIVDGVFYLNTAGTGTIRVGVCVENAEGTKRSVVAAEDHTVTAAAARTMTPFNARVGAGQRLRFRILATDADVTIRGASAHLLTWS